MKLKDGEREREREIVVLLVSIRDTFDLTEIATNTVHYPLHLLRHIKSLLFPLYYYYYFLVFLCLYVSTFAHHLFDHVVRSTDS